MAGMEVGALHSVPVSHGEGKFLASPAVIAELAAKGQIATQYVNTEGTYSMEIDINPNGSLFAIEGITSPCGRVFGKMAHTERSGTRVGKNIPGEKKQPIFAAGVKWFS
jgi:phosphoribosylformylglycinamidine synthase